MQGREGGWDGIVKGFKSIFFGSLAWTLVDYLVVYLLWGLSMQYQRRTEWLRWWRTAYVLN